jgi:predicted dinucleotide-binding enzyme
VTDAARTVGILGAGKVGTVLARLLLGAGRRVLIAGSGEAERISLIVEVLAPGAEARTARDVVDEADAVILALPLGRALGLDPAPFDGKLVIDATNYWEPNDGRIDVVETDSRGTSEIVAAHLRGARVVKAFSHLGYHDLDERGRPAGDPDRVALALAGDDPRGLAIVAAIVDAVGFDPVVAGPLEAGRRFQAHTAAFGVPMRRNDLEAAMGGGRAALRA